MTDLRTAAQQALEALEAIREADTAGATPKMVVEARKMYEPTITALRAALAQEQAEPDAAYQQWLQESHAPALRSTDSQGAFAAGWRAALAQEQAERAMLGVWQDVPGAVNFGIKE